MRAWYFPMCVSSARPLHVADRVEPAAGHAGGAELVVDLDRLAGLEPDRVDAEIVGVRAPSDRDEQLVAGRRCGRRRA